VKQGKGIIRSLNRSGTEDGKRHRAELRTGRLAEPTLCERCGATLVRRVWRRPAEAKPTHAFFHRAHWAVCPTCTQVGRGVVSIDEIDGGLVVLTTSQQLAHRIVHELKKAFGGRASYLWLDDGCLEARWASGPGRARQRA